MRASVFKLFICLIFLVSGPVQAATGDESAFIKSLADQAIDVLSDKNGTLEEREKIFRGLLRDNFAMPLIGRFVVGRYWKAMSPDQQAEYQELFSNWVTKTYSVRLGGYSGQKFVIDRTQKAGQNDVFVRTRIVQEGTAPLRADWRVRNFKGKFMVVDVVVEGVSMLTTQRAEFNAILRQHGPQGLIDALQTRLTKFPAKAG